MDRVKDHVFAAPTLGVAGNHIAAAADHNLVDIAAEPDIKLHLAKPNAAG